MSDKQHKTKLVKRGNRWFIQCSCGAKAGPFKSMIQAEVNKSSLSHNK